MLYINMNLRNVLYGSSEKKNPSRECPSCVPFSFKFGTNSCKKLCLFYNIEYSDIYRSIKNQVQILLTHLRKKKTNLEVNNMLLFMC